MLPCLSNFLRISVIAFRTYGFILDIRRYSPLYSAYLFLLCKDCLWKVVSLIRFLSILASSLSSSMAPASVCSKPVLWSLLSSFKSGSSGRYSSSYYFVLSRLILLLFFMTPFSGFLIEDLGGIILSVNPTILMLGTVGEGF